MNLSAASDFLNPVLVKELRQGLKSKAFGFSFMLIQGLMAVALFAHCMAATTHGGGGGASSMFWTFVGAPLLIILPVLSINAIYSEYKQNTLPLVLLTRLTPWRMVAGKWASLMAQCVLIACAILPYLVLRYFLGGVNVAHDLLVLALVVAGCGLLCAGGLLLSTVKNPWRAFWIIAAIFVVCSPMLIGLAIVIGAFFYGTSGRPGLFPLQLFLLAAALLHAAAGRYTTYIVDNRVAPRIHTILTLMGLIAVIQTAGKFPPALLALPILLPALFHNLRNLAAMVFPAESLGRRTALVQSIAGAGVLAALLAGPLPSPGAVHLLATLVTAIALPAAVVLALRRWLNPFVPMLVFSQIMLLLIGGVVSAIVTNELTSIPVALQVLPVLSYFITCFEKADASFLLVNIVIAVASAAAFVWQFLRARRCSQHRQAPPPSAAAPERWRITG